MGVFIQSLDSVDDLVDEDVGGVLQVGEVLRKLRDLKVLDLDCNWSYFCNANGKKRNLKSRKVAKESNELKDDTSDAAFGRSSDELSMKSSVKQQ